MIWHQPFTLDQVNDRAQGNMGEHLNIVFTAVDDESLTATMPVDHTTKQPFGLLHGGASVALAETVGSTAANLCVDPEQSLCVGMEINANHVRAVRQGHVAATARPIHLGRRSHVWEIKIVDDAGRLVCISRLTMAVVDRKGRRP
jgi:1,4-dihydroxy-2-naphthoyl-CoA hydrolase